MKRYLIAFLTIGQLACGGAQPGDSTPPAGSGAEASAETSPKASAGADTPEEPGREPNDAGEFVVNDADKSSRPTQAKLKATETHAAVRFFVVDKREDQAPIEGIVISLTSPTGEKYYTEETDQDGFAEVLVPIGQKYDLMYLSLGRRNVSAKVEVADKPNLNLKLTMRYKRQVYATGDGESTPGLILDGIQFETGKAKITPDSYERLDGVVEYMTHKKSASIEIAGHTDNVGNKKTNKRLSQKRADAVKKYLVSKGIDAGRIQAVGYGDERPIAPNDTEEGRGKNRRIEAIEL